MADQTGAAMDTLLGLLSTAIRDEAKLLGGIQADMQFIRDEMDSMNGFLLHLTKTDSQHDDQIRAWMKQVRNVSDIAKDCVVLYMRDFEPLQVSSYWSSDFLKKLPCIIWKLGSLHRFATKIKELKDRVREVGERRQRYDVKVRSTQPSQKPKAEKGDEEEARREAFLDALLGPHRHLHGDDGSPCGTVQVGKAIDLLPENLRQRAVTKMIRAIVKGCVSIAAKEMFLRALYAYPHAAQNELENLKKKIDVLDEDPDEAVMIFCYSKLSTDYKNCLQYLSAFQKEDRISRTSMVRRWVAEDLVAKELGRTPEQAAEKCFRKLVFLGFVRPVLYGAAGKVKSCRMDQEIKKFVDDISQSENFVRGNLPYHLEKQVKIREIVTKQQHRHHQPPPDHHKGMLITACGLCTTKGARAAQQKEDPLREMVVLLKEIKLNVLYRLNVLDLGGCKGLRKDHLDTICALRWLKYLSLRATDISVLPLELIKRKLDLLQTLDVRETDVRVTGHNLPPELKHLLAGRAYSAATSTTDEPSPPLTTVPMPRKISTMQAMETLSHVRVDDKHQLELPERIRKLGVLLTGTQNQTIEHLLQAVSKSSDTLRSLSISWPPTKELSSMPIRLEMGSQTEPPPRLLESLHINGCLGNNGLPSWCSSLSALSKVTLCETKLPAKQSLEILGKLQALCCLRLRHKSFVEVTLTFSTGDFCNLRFLLMEDTNIESIEFQTNTAPKLEKITWWCFTNTSTDAARFAAKVLHGMKELRSLKIVEFNPGHPGQRCHKVSTDEDGLWSRILQGRK